MPAPSRRMVLAAVAVAAVLCLAAGALWFIASMPDRPYDPSFDTTVSKPAYQQPGPLVLYDEAHLNVHRASGEYKPLLDLLRNDGYRVEILRQQISASQLEGVAILAIVCPRGPSDAGDDPAFTAGEIAAIEQWVRGGGSLLVVTDHWPFGLATAGLAKRRSVDMSGGMTRDPEHFEQAMGDTHLVFSRDNGLLGDHPITRGRGADEAVARVLSFTGQSLSIPEGATAFLRLSDSALDLPPGTPVVEKSGGDVRVTMEYGEPAPAAGRAQAVALELEKGRIVILGESGMLRAYHDGRGSPIGMNYPGYDNHQLALNIMHWLSRLF